MFWIRKLSTKTGTFTPLYHANAIAVGGRSGRVKTSDGIIDLPLSLPVGLGGPGNIKSILPCNCIGDFELSFTFDSNQNQKYLAMFFEGDSL